MSRIFISHSSKDEVEAIALKDWLVGQGWGEEDDIFLDLDPKRGLAAGDRWEEALRRNIRHCEAVVFIVTPAWCESKWCFAELLQAKSSNKPIFGVISKKVKFSDIPREMTSEWQVVDLTRAGGKEAFSVSSVTDGKQQSVSFNKLELTRLKAGLENTGIDPGFFAWPPEDDPKRSPFPGLRAMQQQDAGIFFGRDAQILAGMDQLRGLNDAPPPRMLVILGASGAGKSSYMRAGLLPRLERDNRHFVVMDPLRPGQKAIEGDEGFAHALSALFEKHGVSANLNKVKKALISAVLSQEDNRGKERANAEPLLSLLRQVCENADAEHFDRNTPEANLPSIVIPVDQAEELYLATDGDNRDEANQLRQLLTLLAKQTQVNVIILLTIRSDSYQHIQLDTVLGSVEHRTQSLPPISQGAYLQIIKGPVTRLNKESDRKLVIETALTEHLLKDVAEGGAKDALPLLAFTLERLYNEYLEDDKLTLAHYAEMGGIAGSIEIAVDQAMDNANAHSEQEKQHQLALLRRGLIPWLATVDPESQEAVRRVAPLSKVPEEARPIIELLVEQRLLSTDIREIKDKTGKTLKDNKGKPKTEVTIEPAHEALLRQWGQLDEWLKEDRDTLSALDGVKRAVQEWEANSKSGEFLAHSSGRLETAEEAATHYRFENYLISLDKEYLSECRKVDNERRNKELEQQKKVTQRTRIGLIAASILTLIAGVLATWGWYESNESEQLATSLKRQTEVAKIAKELANNNEALAKDAQALAENRAEELSEKTEKIQASLDAARLNQVRFLQTTAENAINEEDFDTARALIKTGYDIYNSVDPKRRPYSIFHKSINLIRKLSRLESSTHVLTGHRNDVTFASFSPDNETIITASYDTTAKLWDTKTGEEIMSLKGHENIVTSAQFSPNGKTILTTSADNTAKLWDIETGENFTTLNGYQIFAQFSSDSKTILTTSYDNTAILWDARTGKELQTFTGNTLSLTAAQFSPDEKTILAVSNYGTAILWDTKTGKEKALIITNEHQHTPDIQHAQFSPDGQTILTASEQNPPELWDVETGKKLKTFIGHEWGVTSIKFSPDSNFIITGSLDTTARLWNTKTGEEIKTLKGHKGRITSVQFSHDGKTILTSADDNTARLWNTKTGEKIKVLKGHGDHVISAQFSYDDKTILTGSSDNTARIWDTEPKESNILLIGHQDEVYTAHFSPDSKFIVTASKDTTASLWDTESGEELHILRGHNEAIYSSRFSLDGKTIITASSDNTAKLWNVETGEEIKTLIAHEGSVLSIQLHPDGRTILITSDDNTVMLWDTKNGNKINTLKGHKDPVSSAQFSYDGKKILTTSDDKTAKLWDTETGEEIKTFKHNAQISSARFSFDDKTILTGLSDNTAKLWNTKTGEEIKTLIGHKKPVSSVEFSPDGMTIITASEDTTAKLWNTETGEEIKTLKGHKGIVGSAFFNPNGKVALTTSWDTEGRFVNRETGDFDSTARLWDTETGEQLQILRGHEDIIHYAQFSPDGKTILTASVDSTARLWKTDNYISDKLLHINEPAKFKNLSLKQERDFFIENQDDTKSSVKQVSLNACDAAGSYAFDPKRIGPVLSWESLTNEELDQDKLIKACFEALESQPDEQRYSYQLGRVLLASKSPENKQKGFNLQLEASNNGYAAASYLLGLIYKVGFIDNIRADTKKALSYFQLAKQQGMVIAGNEIALAYWKGNRIPQDKEKAISIWKESAENGDPYSNRKLAKLYALGNLDGNNDQINQNLNKSFRHYALATKIFEQAGATKDAQEARYRRASLARILPESDVLRIWKKVKAWKPKKLQ